MCTQTRKLIWRRCVKTEVGRWNVDWARLVRPPSYLSFPCTALHLHFGSVQRVCAEVSSTQARHLILHVYVTRCDSAVSG